MFALSIVGPVIQQAKKFSAPPRSAWACRRPRYTA